jgi:hypothetical protein
MELDLATFKDIAHELMRRQIRFALVAVEETNSARNELACICGKGLSHQDVAELFEYGRLVFEEQTDEDTDFDLGD